MTEIQVQDVFCRCSGCREGGVCECSPPGAVLAIFTGEYIGKNILQHDGAKQAGGHSDDMVMVER